MSEVSDPISIIENINESMSRSRLNGIFIICLLIGAVQILVDGLVRQEPLIMVVCSIGSIIAVNLYRSSSISVIRGKKNILTSFSAFCGFIPICFLGYITFYLGLWGAIKLFSDFGVKKLIGVIFFTISGFSGAKTLEALTNRYRHAVEMSKKV